jgi:hypothetical protein
VAIPESRGDLTDRGSTVQRAIDQEVHSHALAGAPGQSVMPGPSGDVRIDVTEQLRKKCRINGVEGFDKGGKVLGHAFLSKSQADNDCFARCL